MNQAVSNDFLIDFHTTVNRLLEAGNLGVNELCVQLGMSRSQIHRKIKNLTGNSTSIHIRHIKIDRAARLLSKTDKTISEIAYNCGIQSPQNLSKYFLLAKGVTPSQYRLAAREGNVETSLLSEVINLGARDISLAVLAFKNLGDDPQQSYLGLGMAEEILHGLTRLQGVQIVNCTAPSYSNHDITHLLDLGEELNVDYCLVGSVGSDEDLLRIIVQLIDVNNGFVFWTGRFVEPLDQIFDIQEKIAAQVVSRLEIKLDPKERVASIIESKTKNVEAYHYFLKGREEFELRRDLDLSIYYFKEAIHLDSSFAHAYFGEAFALIYKCIFNGYSPRETLPSIEEAYEAAIIIDNTPPETHIIKAWIYFYFYHDSLRAISFIKKAIAQDEGHPDAHRILAYFYTFRGEYDEGIKYAQIAFDLDANGFNPWFSLADIYRRARRYDESLALFESLIEEYPQIPIVKQILGLVYLHSGQVQKAHELLPLPQSYPQLIGLWELAPYFIRLSMGDSAPLSDLLDHLERESQSRYIQPTILALLSFHLDQEDKAITYLQEAKRSLDFGLNHIISEPYWDDYRQHPEVQELLHLIGMI